MKHESVKKMYCKDMRFPEVEYLVHEIIIGDSRAVIDEMTTLSDKLSDNMTMMYSLAAIVCIASCEAVNRVAPLGRFGYPDLISVFACKSYDELYMNIINSLSEAEMIIKEFSNDFRGNVVDKIKKYIDLKYEKQIFVSELSDAVGLSPYYLGKIFKEYTGETITEYIHLKRINKACDLLIDTNEKIGTIALDIGYRDANYFSSSFKKIMGISPREYRENRFKKF